MNSRLHSAMPLAISFLCLSTLSRCVIIWEKPSPPPAPCPVESVLLETADLPIVGIPWFGGDIGEPPSRVLASKAGVGFYTSTQGGISQDVYNFWYLKDAKKYYKDAVCGWFTATNFETEWITPDDLQDLSINADIYDLRCSNSLYSGNELCRYFSRYEDYVIELSADIVALNHEQFSELIKKVDRKMKNCFGEQN